MTEDFNAIVLTTLTMRRPFTVLVFMNDARQTKTLFTLPHRLTALKQEELMIDTDWMVTHLTRIA